jgi:shikimate dehydrogenase
MKQYAVIGHPISHSLSPLMHNTAFKLLDLECQYEMIDIAPDSLQQKIEHFRDQKWGGFNITIPHKEAIIPLIDEVVPEARAIGAVNTVVHHQQKLIGHNTDVIGIERSLLPHQAEIENSFCTIMGSGGVARSVAFALSHHFKPKAITFSALFPEQAQALIKSLNCTDVPCTVIPCADPALESAIKASTLLVNATDVGMYPRIHHSPLPNRQWLSKNHIVFDLVYRPLVTQLQKDAKDSGARTIDGLGMFVHQGAAAFQLWTGKDMPYEQVRKILEDTLTRE